MVWRESPVSIDIGYESVYKLKELTLFENLFYMKMPNSTRCFMGKSLANMSPFKIRKTVRWTQLLNQAANTHRYVWTPFRLY